MAKNEKSKDVESNDVVNDVPQAVEVAAEVQQVVDPVSVAPVEAPVAVVPDVMMAVHKQHALHHAASNPMQALLPGHDLVPAHDGLMGGIEGFSIQSEKNGEYSLAADLQNLLAKLGEVAVYIDVIKSKYSGKLNPSLLNLLSSFH